MKNTRKKSIIRKILSIVSVFALVLSISVFFGGAVSAQGRTASEQRSPSIVVEYDLPGGSYITARVYGNEFYRRIESLCGYTLVRDPQTGFYCYAQLNSDGSDFESTRIVYRDGDVAPPNILKGLMLADEHVKRIYNENWMQLRGNQNVVQRTSATPTRNNVNSSGVQEIIGLTVAINFPNNCSAMTDCPIHDSPSDCASAYCSSLRYRCYAPEWPYTPRPCFDIALGFEEEDIYNFLNQEGYDEFGNNGSIRDYFLDVSVGKADYYNIVFSYDAQFCKGFYDRSSALVLAQEVIIQLGDKNPTNFKGDFFSDEIQKLSTVSITSQGENSIVEVVDDIIPLNLFYAGRWANGLNPGFLSISLPEVHGVQFKGFQYTGQERLQGKGLSIGTVAHETGHLVFGFEDNYMDYNMGYYCLMGYGGLAGVEFWEDDSKNPIPPTAYLRYQAGWIEPISLNEKQNGSVIQAEANSYGMYKYTTDSDNEYFLIEYIQNGIEGCRYYNFPSSGIMIYHIDEDGVNSHIGYGNGNPRSRIAAANNTAFGWDSIAYPWKNNNRFTTMSTPSSILNDNSLSELSLTNITSCGTFVYNKVDFEIVMFPKTEYTGGAVTHLNSIEFSTSTAYRSSSLNGTISKYNSSGGIIGSPINITINVDDKGKGIWDGVPLTIQTPGEYVVIEMRDNNNSVIARQEVHPIRFIF